MSSGHPRATLRLTLDDHLAAHADPSPTPADDLVALDTQIEELNHEMLALIRAGDRRAAEDLLAELRELSWRWARLLARAREGRRRVP